MRSLKANCDKNKKYIVHILYDPSVTPEQIDDINALSEENVQIKVKAIDDKFITLSNSVSKVNQVSKCAVCKFYLADIYKNLDTILYIDCDTLILHDLSSCFDTLLNMAYCAVVRDYNIYQKTNGFHRDIILRNNGYFNSGVMLLNLHLLRRQNAAKKLLEYRLYGKNMFMDQDALNVVFGGHVRWLDCNWNFLACNTTFDKNDLMKFYSVEKIPMTVNEIIKSHDIKILHLAGAKKPWNDKSSPWCSYWNRFSK